MFAVNQQHVRSLCKTFREHNVEARSIISSTPFTERMNILDDFRQGKFPVLVNCSILTEVRSLSPFSTILLY